MDSELPDSDAVALLQTEHRNLLKLFDEFEQLSARPEALAQEILDRLGILTRIETEIFYPALITESHGNTPIEQSSLNHRAFQTQADLIRTKSADDAGFDTLMLALIEQVRRHIAQEEAVLYPGAREVLGGRLLDIAVEMQALKDEAAGAGGVG